MTLFDAPEGSTPLHPQDQRGLRQSWITNRDDLNAAEQANILAGRAWALRSRVVLTSEDYLRRLHRRMFGDVWSWAGHLRTVETNIGALPHEIPSGYASFSAMWTTGSPTTPGRRTNSPPASTMGWC